LSAFVGHDLCLARFGNLLLPFGGCISIHPFVNAPRLSRGVRSGAATQSMLSSIVSPTWGRLNHGNARHAAEAACEATGYTSGWPHATSLAAKQQRTAEVRRIGSPVVQWCDHYRSVQDTELLVTFHASSAELQRRGEGGWGRGGRELGGLLVPSPTELRVDSAFLFVFVELAWNPASGSNGTLCFTRCQILTARRRMTATRAIFEPRRAFNCLYHARQRGHFRST